jgi:copper chaperone CopZ
LLFWLAAAAVVAFAEFPYYSEPVAAFVLKERSASAASTQPAAPRIERVTFGIEGMDCGACAATIEGKLKALPGVRQAAVSYASGKAEVDYQPGSVSVSALEKAIEEAGYRSREIQKGESIQ